jgi:hypothetical protein
VEAGHPRDDGPKYGAYPYGSGRGTYKLKSSVIFEFFGSPRSVRVNSCFSCQGHAQQRKLTDWQSEHNPLILHLEHGLGFSSLWWGLAVRYIVPNLDYYIGGPSPLDGPRPITDAVLRGNAFLSMIARQTLVAETEALTRQ